MGIITTLLTIVVISLKEKGIIKLKILLIMCILVMATKIILITILIIMNTPKEIRFTLQVIIKHIMIIFKHHQLKRKLITHLIMFTSLMTITKQWQ